MVANETKKYKCQDVLRPSQLEGSQPSPALRNRLSQNLRARYCDVFSALIACEEQQMWIDIRRYDLPEAVFVPKGEFLELTVSLLRMNSTRALNASVGSWIGGEEAVAVSRRQAVCHLV